MLLPETFTRFAPVMFKPVPLPLVAVINGIVPARFPWTVKRLVEPAANVNAGPAPATLTVSDVLGVVLVPAIVGRFQELTQRRYQTVQLTAQLATEGIMVSGELRPTAQISVGTREQLSTLYRLSLAEYLDTTIVLDDQLVQSDDNRMDWFRALPNDKARSFQIVVFTCRPGDYLVPSSLVPQGNAVHADTDDGFIRAVDLGRALRRR